MPNWPNINIDEGSGETVLLLHGFMGCADDWIEMIARLRSKYRLVAIDLPGHGSTSAGLSGKIKAWQQVIDDLENFIISLKSDRLHLLGYSMGGRIALSLALRRPDLLSTLILEAASPGLESKTEQLRRREQELDWASQLTADKHAYLESWAKLPLFNRQRERNHRESERLLHLRTKGEAAGWIDAMRQLGLSAQPNYWPQLAQLKLPTLLITGDEDIKFAEIGARMADDISDSVHHSLPHAGHSAHLEQPELFANTIVEFLARHKA